VCDRGVKNVVVDRFVNISGNGRIAKSAEADRSATISGGGQRVKNAEVQQSANISGGGHSVKNVEVDRSVSISGGGQDAKNAEAHRSANISVCARNAKSAEAQRSASISGNGPSVKSVGRMNSRISASRIQVARQGFRLFEARRSENDDCNDSHYEQPHSVTFPQTIGRVRVHFSSVQCFWFGAQPMSSLRVRRSFDGEKWLSEGGGSSAIVRLLVS
jgi:hypothetical protein